MTEMKASQNPVSLHIFVSVCISIHAHVYINSYIHELLIVLMLTRPEPIMLLKLPIMLLSNAPNFSLLCPNYAPLCPIMLHYAS